MVSGSTHPERPPWAARSCAAPHLLTATAALVSCALTSALRGLHSSCLWGPRNCIRVWVKCVCVCVCERERESVRLISISLGWEVPDGCLHQTEEVKDLNCWPEGVQSWSRTGRGGGLVEAAELETSSGPGLSTVILG